MSTKRIVIIEGREYTPSASGILRDADGFDPTGRDRWGRDRDGFSRSGIRHSDGAVREDTITRNSGPYNGLRTEAADLILDPDDEGFISTSQARWYLMVRIASLTNRRTDIPFVMSSVVAPWSKSFRNHNLTHQEAKALLAYRATRAGFDALVDDGLIVKYSATTWRLTETGATLAAALTPHLDDEDEQAEA